MSDAPAAILVFEIESAPRFFADYTNAEASRLVDWFQASPPIHEVLHAGLELVRDDPDLAPQDFHVDRARLRLDVVRASLGQRDLGRARRAARALLDELDAAAALFAADEATA